MDYEKIGFKDRIIERPMTYNVITNDDGTITLEPITGEIYEEGTDINANNMDHIEEGIVLLNNNIKILQTKDTELNTKITNLQNNVYVKGNYAVLTGNVSINANASSGSVDINYPSGFTNDNCVVISVMAQRNDTKVGYKTIQTPDASSLAGGNTNLAAMLTSSTIKVQINYSGNISGGLVSNYKLVLFKYK